MKTIRIALLLSCLTFAFGTPPDTSAQTRLDSGHAA